MSIKPSVVLRIKDICEQKGITLNALATKSGLTPSTVYTLVNDERKDVGICTIKKICDGLEIGLAEFFDSDRFDKLDQELK
jgi:Predicted transcriptional regulators